MKYFPNCKRYEETQNLRDAMFETVFFYLLGENKSEKDILLLGISIENMHQLCL